MFPQMQLPSGAPSAPRIPRMEPPPAPAGDTYTVKAGDTWESIAAQLGVSLDELMAANPDVDEPRPGDTLVIPAAGGAPTGGGLPPYMGGPGM